MSDTDEWINTAARVTRRRAVDTKYGRHVDDPPDPPRGAARPTCLRYGQRVLNVLAVATGIVLLASGRTVAAEGWERVPWLLLPLLAITAGVLGGISRHRGRSWWFTGTALVAAAAFVAGDLSRG